MKSTHRCTKIQTRRRSRRAAKQELFTSQREIQIVDHGGILPILTTDEELERMYWDEVGSGLFDDDYLYDDFDFFYEKEEVRDLADMMDECGYDPYMDLDDPFEDDMDDYYDMWHRIFDKEDRERKEQEAERNKKREVELAWLYKNPDGQDSPVDDSWDDSEFDGAYYNELNY